jgi:hypothetical protein
MVILQQMFLWLQEAEELKTGVEAVVQVVCYTLLLKRLRLVVTLLELAVEGTTAREVILHLLGYHQQLVEALRDT